MRRTISVALLALFFLSPLFGAMSHNRIKHTRRVPRLKLRHPRWHPMFPPSAESLFRQNAEIDHLGLERIQNDRELQELVARKKLVPLPLGPGLTVDPRLPANRRYCRPWTAQFLKDLSTRFWQEFHKPLQVNSAVRTIEFQKKLARRNRNAAPPDGEKASSHLAGLTIDLQRKRLSTREVKWLQKQLLELRDQGLVEVEEEYYQFCFHIMVSAQYEQPAIDLPTFLGQQFTAGQ